MKTLISILVVITILGTGAVFVVDDPGDGGSVPLNGVISHRHVNDVRDALRVSYVGFDRGSERVVVTVPLEEALTEAELGFEVKFCDGFDFAMGGKLHGLGPAQPVAGGSLPEPSRWSARLMWRDNGSLQTYVYHQDMKGRFGDAKRAPDFKFEPGRYHAVRMRVVLNDPVDEANGAVTVWVDGDEIINHPGLRFRGDASEEALINSFLFNTFHGGSSPDWAPRDADGNYKTDCAYFRNINVS